MKMKETKLMEEKQVPDFENLREVFSCSNCQKKCRFAGPGRGTPSSGWDCDKKKKNVKRIELILGVIIEVLIICLVYFLLKNFWLILLISVATIGIMIYIDDVIFSGFGEKQFKTKEDKRKSEYENVAQKIKDENEIIRRKNNGETPEYIQFIEKAKVLEKSISEAIKTVSENNITSQDNEINSISTNLSNLLKKVQNLTKRLKPQNYKYPYIEKFYTSHLPLLISNINSYPLKELSIKEKMSLLNLIKSFEIKVEHVDEALQEQNEKDFILKMEALKKEIDNSFE